MCVFACLARNLSFRLFVIIIVGCCLSVVDNFWSIAVLFEVCSVFVVHLCPVLCVVYCVLLADCLYLLFVVRCLRFAVCCFVGHCCCVVIVAW